MICLGTSNDIFILYRNSVDLESTIFLKNCIGTDFLCYWLMQFVHLIYLALHFITKYWVNILPEKLWLDAALI